MVREGTEACRAVTCRVGEGMVAYRLLGNQAEAPYQAGKEGREEPVHLEEVRQEAEGQRMGGLQGREVLQVSHQAVGHQSEVQYMSEVHHIPLALHLLSLPIVPQAWQGPRQT